MRIPSYRWPPRRGKGRYCSGISLFWVLLWLYGPIHAAELSTDVTVASTSGTASDDMVINRGPSPFSFPGVPASADLTAFHRFADGDTLIAFDTAISLPGNIFARAGDIVRFDGAGYSIEWRPSDAGLSGGIVTDAITDYRGDLALSFDTTVILPGNVFLNDEDLVRITANGYELLLDGSALGIDSATDLDGASYFLTDSGELFFLSFSESGQVSGTEYDDEDVLIYNAATGLWSLLYDGFSRLATRGIDIDAVFESVVIFSDGFEDY